jgi:hypothetical protein
MTLSPQDAQKALTVIQLGQMIGSLTGLLVQAIQNGSGGVTDEQLADAFADKDAALAEQALAIAKAKAEGR